jgi:2-oxoglutarate ferredoxin oxidoreductase subunit alpha
MVQLRQDKIAGIAREIPLQQVQGAQEGDLLIVGWGSTYGAITAAVQRARAEGRSVGHAHIRYLNPFPSNLGELFGRFKRFLVPEMNLGQLAMLLRASYGITTESLTKVQGKPFTEGEISGRIAEMTTRRETA